MNKVEDDPACDGLATTPRYQRLVQECDTPTRVISALHDLAPVFIKWPSQAGVRKISRSFQEVSGFPGIIGDLGQYRFNELYVTEKDDNNGILFQAICDHTRKFTHCHIASSNSEMNEWLNNYLGDATLFPANTHLISTSPYPLHENLMVPYKEESDMQKNFNKKLVAASVIGECLGNLLGRFESLHRGLSLNKTNRTHLVACCVLHNICELKCDKYKGERIKIEKMSRSSFPCSLRAKMKRDAIAAKLSNS
ncbi:hypothetical protein MSG28_013583 [Choristoneura fumiferana]|uniref:Uncharacterized protein n=1 Tax=Choristoneura fumiferana TaxID=7141 RepID=A0ACC0K7X2_CHOFU|nr:hypothetical protein MSG28_013583 [Choristoneura fumiferana]